MKPATEITDRAKRYRANLDVPDGPKLCGFCGETHDLGVDHLDGYEEHGEPENLMWLCRSCNQLKAAVYKRAGIGRTVNQYNPFKGLFSGIFGSKKTYSVSPAKAYREEKARLAREKREEHERERRDYVAEKKRERAEKGHAVSRFKGVTIYRKGSGEYYTSLDPDSEFESLKDAKAVVGHFRNPATTDRGWARAVAVLRGDEPAPAGPVRHAARVVRSTPPAARLRFLGGLLKRTKGNPIPSLAQYRYGVSIHKGREWVKGQGWTRGDKDEGGAIIHATPAAKRREYARKMAARRGRRRDEVPF
jgi:hypothetical protein